MNVAFSVVDPAVGVVPEAGEYAKLPGTLAVASSCVEPSAVPYVIAAGVGQVIVGATGFTRSKTLAVAVL